MIRVTIRSSAYDQSSACTSVYIVELNARNRVWEIVMRKVLALPTMVIE